MGIDPRIMAVFVVVALTYYGAKETVHEVKKVEHKIVHVIKHEKK